MFKDESRSLKAEVKTDCVSDRSSFILHSSSFERAAA
jgi:hypothetical protein